MKSCLERNDIKMYSTHDEGKSVVVERFIRTLKSEIYKCMTSISKNVYIDKLDDILNEKLKLKQLMLKIIHILTLVKKLMMKNPNLKLVTM